MPFFIILTSLFIGIKKRLLLFLIFCGIYLPTISFATDIEAILPTSNSSSGFVIKDSGSHTEFKVAGDGSLTLATSIGAAYLSTATRHTQSINRTAKTVDYTFTSSDGVILADPSGGAFTVTLPTAAGSAGRTYSVVMKGGGQAVTVDGNGSETIDGALTTSLASTGTALTVISDGNNWHSLSMTTAGNTTSSGSAYGKIAIVASSGGDYTSPNDAVTQLSTWCGTPSSANPCLISISPGYYTLTSSLDLSNYNYLSVRGAGEQATFVAFSDDHVLQLANESEVSHLTVLGSGSTSNKYGISIDGKAVRLNNVTVKMTSTTFATYGVTVSGASAALTGNSVSVSSAADSAGGIYHDSAGTVSWNDLVVTAGGSSSVGLSDKTSAYLLIKNSAITATGSNSNALQLLSLAPNIRVQNSTFSSVGNGIAMVLGLSASQLYFENIQVSSNSGRGINATNSTAAVTLELRNSQIHAPNSTGLYINDSDYTILAANTLIDATTAINQNNTGATLTCFNLYTSSFSAITGTSASTCDTNNN